MSKTKTRNHGTSHIGFFGDICISIKYTHALFSPQLASKCFRYHGINRRNHEELLLWRYLINDFYKNAYKKVDLYNDMYPSLYNLWLKIYQLVLAINNRQLDESLSNDTLHTSIITNLCGVTNEDTTRKIDRDVSADMFHILYILWSDAIKDKYKFLEVYGNIVEREEYSKLNDKELDISVERLKEYVPKDEQIVKALPITIRDYDIERSVYLILKYKTDLASMVNKYSIYYYGNQRGIRTDAF